jgi:WD40 repeat protein
MLIDSVSGRETVFARGRRLSGVVSPSFSPDGRQIVYGRYDQTGGDLYVYNATSGKAKQITRDHKDFDPSWGPRWIAFNRSGSIRGGDVWLVRPDGTGTHRLTHTNAGIYPAAWSANGRRLLAANPATHNGRLWGVEVSSGRAHDLTGWVGDLFPQGLSRDGTTILAAIGCGGLASPYGIVETLPFAGGKPTVIVKGPCRASWNR